MIDSVIERIDDYFDGLRRRRGTEAPLALFLLAPALLVLGIFGLAPLAGAVYLSLFDYELVKPPFVGLAKYDEALRDPEFWNSVRVTLYYIALTVPATLVLSFFVAYALYRLPWWRGLLRTAYFLPYVTSVVAAAMVWRALFSHPRGVANLVLEYLGLPGQTWLIEQRGLLHILTNEAVPADVGPSLALCCVILFDIWHGCGFMIVILLAGLTAIPRELEDAARIDGAGPFQVIRRITLPLLSPTLFLLGIVATIRAFQAFNSFYALTQQPDRALFRPTTNMILFIYSKLYRDHDFGYGAAVATLFTVAIVLLTAVQWRYLGRKVHYS